MLISRIYLSTRFHLFLWSHCTWQVEGVKMTRAGARCCAALPVPALEAHGGSAGALGHHIDLALTDTCRGEGGVRKGGRRGHRTARLCHLTLPVAPPPDRQETSATMPPPNLNPPPTTPLGHGKLECLPLPHTVLPVQTWRTNPKTNNSDSSTVAPLWATHPVTNKLNYH